VFIAGLGRATDAAPVFNLDNPTVAICPAAPDANFHAQMTALDKASNDLLDALLGHAAFGGEMRDAGPCAPLAFVDQVSENLGQHEGKRCQLRVAMHLVKP
jgi:hypothetical protein